MNIEFKKEILHAQMLSPFNQFEEISVPTEIRYDPLLGYSSRITVLRKGQWEKNSILPDISKKVLDIKGCPFCLDNSNEKVPRYTPDFYPEPVIQSGEALCFPNLYPYGDFSSVAIFSKKHYIPIGEFTPEQYLNCFSVARKYLKAVMKADNQIIFNAVTQNYLPSSGGSLVHPHLQVNADRYTPNFPRFLMNSLTKYKKIHGTKYFHDLMAVEEKSLRWIGKNGAITWFTPFAPLGQIEVCAIIRDFDSILSLPDEIILTLVKGLISIQKYYKDSGINSFNFAVYSFPESIEYYDLFIRMTARMNYEEFPRNDMTYRETMLMEAAVELSPEKVAADCKNYFPAINPNYSGLL